MRQLYLDANSTTPMLLEVWEAMRPYALEDYANPASAHQSGRRARCALEDHREQLAALLGAFPDEVVFTSGATESNNLALTSLAGDPPGHLLAAAIEHPSVIEPLARLRKTGFRYTTLPVNDQGQVLPDSFSTLLEPDTTLVAVMLANHETGTIQPVQKCTEFLQGSATRLHCDAVQAVGKIPVHFHHLGTHTLSLSAHKFHGPRGIGALLVRRGVQLRPTLFGGHQQQGRRPGTEPVALVVGLVTALTIACQTMQERTQRFRQMRQLFLAPLQDHPYHINGSDNGLPSTLNVSFPGLPGDSLLMNLDLSGVACSMGAACASGSLLPSPVLKAMNLPDAVLQGSLRFSFHALLTEEDAAQAGHRVAQVLTRLRQLDPSSD